MGAACCVAIKDRTIHHGSSGENIRHSPTWSFRWDNRVGVVAEDPSSWSPDLASRSDALDVKSATDVSAIVSDGGSSLESFRMGAWRKSPLNSEIAKSLRPSSSGEFIARNASSEVKQSADSPQASAPVSVKQSTSMQTTPSLCLSPSSVQSNPHPSQPTLSRWAQISPGPHAVQQTSEIHSSGRNSPMDDGHALHGASAASIETARGSYGRSSDGLSSHAFADLMSTSQRGRWSFGSDSRSIICDKLSRTSDPNSRSMSVDLQSCGICSKLLTEKLAWSSQNIVTRNELSVVAVLLCGHVYHAECLEDMTSDINKYDPTCPVCTFGEKQTLKLAGEKSKAGKVLKVGISKKSRNQVLDTDDAFDFDYSKTSLHEGKSPKLSNSSSLRISAAKPFLKRHFSFGSKGNKSPLENPSIRKQGFFWTKSSRV